MDPLPSSLVFLGLWMLGMTQIRSSVLVFALQTLLLGGMAAQHGLHAGDTPLAIAGVAFFVIKGMCVPLYLLYVMRRLASPHDEGLHIAPASLMFITVSSLALLLLVPSFRTVIPPNAMPAFALLLIGMLMMLSRRLAISQIVGFLVLENSIFLYTISQPYSMPLVVELGVLLEIFAWTMMAGVLAFDIKDRFESIDVSELKELRG